MTDKAKASYKDFLLSLRNLIDSNVDAEGARRALWRQAVIASLQSGCDATTAVGRADHIVAADIQRDDENRGMMYGPVYDSLLAAVLRVEKGKWDE